MSTIASPRPSISISSRRTSASTDTTATVDRGSLRRNRAALRDYYGLKAAAPADVRDVSGTSSLDVERESALDKPDFDAAGYVAHLLAREGLEGVLKVEAGLVSEMRSLDGERKALVYDNYSKLIAATDTIRSMRERMDPLTPTTSTLTPAISHIAETAHSLSSDLRASHSGARMYAGPEQRERDQQATVRWVLAAPKWLEMLMKASCGAEAETEWQEVRGLLDLWKNVEGAEDVRRACLQTLGKDDEG